MSLVFRNVLTSRSKIADRPLTTRKRSLRDSGLMAATAAKESAHRLRNIRTLTLVRPLHSRSTAERVGDSDDALVARGTMIFAGVIGGLINYLLAEKPATTGQRLQKWWQYMVIGLGASFVVPLFLNTISSQLVKDVLERNAVDADAGSKLLVIAGFCILAAVTSRSFMQTLAARVLRVAEEAKRQSEEAAAVANEAKSDIALVVEPESPLADSSVPSTHPLEIVKAAKAFDRDTSDASPQSDSSAPAVDEASEPPDADEAYEALPGGPALTPTQKSILTALVNSSFSLRSVNGIAKDIGKDASLVEMVIRLMRLNGLVSSTKDSREHERYAITTAGRRELWTEQLIPPPGSAS